MEQKVTAYLRQLKEARGYTQQQIADESGVPIGTIGKYFSALDDESASYEIIRKLVVCLGGSLDEMAGISSDEHKDDGGTDEAYRAVIAGLEARLDEKDERISARWKLAEKEREHAESEIAYERRRSKIATILSYAVLGLFALMVLLDYLLPTFGWIRR